MEAIKIMEDKIRKKEVVVPTVYARGYDVRIRGERKGY